MPKFEGIAPAGWGSIRQAPTEDVSVNLGDDKWRPLRYTIKTLKLMKVRGIVAPFRDEDLPELIWIGLHDTSGNPPEDVTIEDLEQMPVAWIPYLGKAFIHAYGLSQPKNPPKPDEEKKD